MHANVRTRAIFLEYVANVNTPITIKDMSVI